MTTNFILEFGWGYIRFWTNGIQVVAPADWYDGEWVTAHSYPRGHYVHHLGLNYISEFTHTSGVFADDLAANKWIETSALEVPSPYQTADLRELQYCQINDLMYIAHPNYPLYKLTRLADDSWSFAEVDWKWPPLQDENIKNIYITPSGTSGNITLTSSATIFDPNDVGSTWQIGHNMAGAFQTWFEIALGVSSATTGVIRAWCRVLQLTEHGPARSDYSDDLPDERDRDDRAYHNTVVMTQCFHNRD